MFGILRWRDEWTLQIDVLDEDHVALVELFNRIVGLYANQYAGSHRSGAGGALAGVADREAERAVETCPLEGSSLVQCLDAFSQRAHQHFQREEDFMRTIGYPDYVVHKSEHAQLLAELASLLRGLTARGEVSLDAETLGTLKTWLIGHIVGEDKRFADYYYDVCGARARTQTGHGVE